MNFEHIDSALSATFFFIIPAFTGYLIKALVMLARKLLRKQEPAIFIETSGLEYFVVKFSEYFVYGSIFIFISNIFGSQILKVGFEQTAKAMYVLSTVGIFFYIAEKLSNHNKTLSKYLDIRLLPSLVFVVLAIGVYSMWRLDSPASATLNWDLYHHQLLATQILENKFSVLTTQLSDTFQFGGYTTMFHTIMATSQYLFVPSILNYWYFVELIYFGLTLLIGYSVAQIVFKNKIVSLITVVFCAFSFESNSAYTSFFLIPQNLTASLVALFVARTIKRVEQGLDGFDFTNIAFIVFATLMHLIIGPTGLAFLLYVILWAALKGVFKQATQSEETTKLDWALSILSVALLIVFPLVVSAMDLSYLNRGEAQYFNFSFEEKIEYFRIFLGYLPIIFIPLGLIYLLFENNTRSKMIFVLVLGMITVIVSPIPYSMKFISYSRYFIYPVMSLGIWMLMKSAYLKARSKVLKVFILLPIITALATSMVVIFTINTAIYKQVPSYKNTSTHVTQNEIEAAEFVRSTYKGTSTMLISDPATMHIVETLSGVNTPGGAYTDQNTRAVISEIFFSRDSQTLSERVFDIKDSLDKSSYDKIVFVVSGRFTKWQLGSNEEKSGIFWNVWTPYDLTLEAYSKYDFLDFITNFSNFKEVYRNQGVIVLELSRYQ